MTAVPSGPIGALWTGNHPPAASNSTAPPAVITLSPATATVATSCTGAPAGADAGVCATLVCVHALATQSMIPSETDPAIPASAPTNSATMTVPVGAIVGNHVSSRAIPATTGADPIARPARRNSTVPPSTTPAPLLTVATSWIRCPTATVGASSPTACGTESDTALSHGRTTTSTATDALACVPDSRAITVSRCVPAGSPPGTATLVSTPPTTSARPSSTGPDPSSAAMTTTVAAAGPGSGQTPATLTSSAKPSPARGRTGPGGTDAVTAVGARSTAWSSEATGEAPKRPSPEPR